MNFTLDIATTGLSLYNAKVLCAAAADAYADPADITSTATDTQLKVYPVSTVGGGQVVVVSYRGTFNRPGWFRDADVLRQNLNGCDIHRGFMQDVLSLSVPLCKKLDGYGLPVFVTGHSKGAAEAMVSAWVLNQRGYLVAGVYTFGQPRVGDAAFKASYDRALGGVTWRFVNGSDIVPRVPWLMGLYQHAGNEVYMPAGNIGGLIPSAAYKVNPSSLYTALCDGKELAKEWWREVPMLADHHIEAYTKAVNSLT